MDTSLRNKYSPLNIYCRYLEFDNFSIIDIEDAFKFWPFDGDKEVTALEGYPIRYKKYSPAANEDLEARGRRFLDLILVSHKRYDGLTIDGTIEEVRGIDNYILHWIAWRGLTNEQINSDVIIDRELSVQQSSDWESWNTPIENRWFPTKTHVTEIMEIPKRMCSHKDCHNPECFEDAYVHQQRQKFQENIEHLDNMMEQHDLVDIRTREDIAKCKEVLKKVNMLGLFPAVVTGWSLRNRKWGEFFKVPQLECSDC